MFLTMENQKQGEIKAKTQKLIKNPKQDFEKAINTFLTSQTGKFGKYIAVENALVYRTLIQERGDVFTRQNIIAYRTKKGQILGNSAVLPLIGRTVAFGTESLNRGQTEVQRALSDLVVMIPFSVFTEAGLNLETFSVIERGPEEKVTRKTQNPKYNHYKQKEMRAKNIPEFIEETVHFTGASLFRVDNNVFLFDIDREEIKHQIFNPFLVKIPNLEVKNIGEAYNSLKPLEVVEAEKQGLEVVRQGEWFFIPVEKIKPGNADRSQWQSRSLHSRRRDRSRFQALELRAGRNRPNHASFGIESKGLVKGRVEHSGREHRTILLRQWHKAIPNTAIESFTLVGDID